MSTLPLHPYLFLSHRLLILLPIQSAWSHVSVCQICLYLWADAAYVKSLKWREVRAQQSLLCPASLHAAFIHARRQVRLHEGLGDESHAETRLLSNPIQDSWLTHSWVLAWCGVRKRVVRTAAEWWKLAVICAICEIWNCVLQSACTQFASYAFATNAHLFIIHSPWVCLCERQSGSLASVPTTFMHLMIQHTRTNHADMDFNLLDQHVLSLSAGPGRSVHTLNLKKKLECVSLRIYKQSST